MNPEAPSHRNQGRRPRGLPLLAAAAALCALAQCRLGSDPDARGGNYVTVRLNDSLSRFDSVSVQILAGKDTTAILGTPWSGRLDQPGAIPSYRLGDGEAPEVSIRVRAWDANGRLALDELITKVDGKQIVTVFPIQKPSPRLASLSLSAGTLSPAFSPGTREYSATVPHSQVNLQVTVVPEYAEARLFAGARQIAAGQPSEAVPLDTGSNRLTLSVFAEDTSQQYILLVRREAAPPDTGDPDPIDTGHVDPPPPVDTLFSKWKYKGLVVLRLPTAPSGSPSPSLALDFPLLLRLDSSNFDFSGAADSGRDLRFADARGKVLDYAIARWNAAARAAEVYVRCDTLSSAGDAPVIKMYWGNPQAGAASNSARVFPPASGWTGVWHLEEAGAGRAGEYADATGANPGTAAGGFPARTAGPVGKAQDFDGNGSQGWIVLPKEYDPGQGRFSMNMWIFGEGRSTAYVFIKSGAAASDQRFELDISQGTGNYGLGSNGVRTYLNFGAQTAAWQLLGIVCGTDSIRIYTNGVLKDTRPFSLQGNPLANVIIGARNPSGDSGFPGGLDEIWSYSGIRDAWYMRLLYENQKPGSTLATLTPY